MRNGIGIICVVAAMRPDLSAVITWVGFGLRAVEPHAL